MKSQILKTKGVLKSVIFWDFYSLKTFFSLKLKNILLGL